MAIVLDARAESDVQAAVETAAGVLASGGIVAYPTDTLYGLAVDPRNRQAVRRLFEVKGRAPDVPVPLIAADVEQVRATVERLTAVAERLGGRFWPGPLTLVLSAGPLVVPEVCAGRGTIAIRVPDHPIATRLAAAAGFPLTATSANRSGEAPAATAADAVAQVGDRIDLVIDGGPTAGGLPSTIVDVTTVPPRLVRPGVVSWERVLESLQ